MQPRLAIPGIVLALLLAAFWWWLESAERPFGIERQPAGQVLRWQACNYEHVRDVRCATLHLADDTLGEVVLPLVLIGKNNPGQDPVIYLPGGPGGDGWLDEEGIAYHQWLWNQLDTARDLIVFDPRGTGGATPQPQCPELQTLSLSQLGQALAADDMTRAEAAAMDACLQALEGQGVDLAGFSTASNLGDLEQLMSALQREGGYSGFHLWGVSYGSRLALQQLRREDPRVRSVVLDGLYPPDVDALASSGELLRLLIRRIDELCAESQLCRDQLAEGQSPVLALAEQLQQQPLQRSVRRTGRPDQAVALNGTRLLLALFLDSYSNESLAYLPLMMHQLQQGDHSALDPLLWSMLYMLEDDSVNGVVLAAVECQDAAHFSNAQWQAVRAAYPEMHLLLGSFFDEHVCQRMGLSPAPLDWIQPVASDVPALLFSSKVDVVTSASWGQQAAQTLTRSRHIELPASSHGTALHDPCARQLAQRFWSTLELEPMTCENQWQPIQVIDDPAELRKHRKRMAVDYEVVD